MNEEEFKEQYDLLMKLYIREIHDTRIDTRILRQLIDKYGVNCIYRHHISDKERHGWRLIQESHIMTEEQIDVLFDHQVEYIDHFILSKGERRMYWECMNGANGAYTFQKILEQNPGISIIHERTAFFDHDLRKIVTIQLFDMKHLNHKMHDIGYPFEEISMLVHNHVKKYQSLFELLLPSIENCNKKPKDY